MFTSMMRKALLADDAKLSLDFTSGVLPSGVTFSRAANTATRINSSKLVETMSADQPRFDHDPTTGSPRGLLIEGAATNLVPRSNDFNTTVTDGTQWVVGGYTRGDVSTTLPDGTTGNACRISGTGSASFRSQSIAVTASTAYTFSFWARNNGGSQARYRVWNATAASSIVDYTLPSSNYVSQIGGSNNTSTTWVRVSVTFTTPVGCTSIFVYPTSSDSGTVDLLLWGAQVEAGSGASSYIPTGASQATRNPDICTVSGAAFSSWYNASEGTFFADFRRRRTDNTASVLSANNNSTAEVIELAADTAAKFNIVDNGSSQVASFKTPFVANTDTKLACAFQINNCQMALNGAVSTVDSTATIPTVDRLYIGRDAGAVPVYLDGHVRSVKFYDVRKDQTKLGEMTT